MASYNIVGQVDLKPLQKATKAFSKFDKQTQFWAKHSRKAYLAVSAAATYYAQRLARESVQAALADEKSQRQLAFTLQQVAGANDAATFAAEANISSMSKMYGIADDQLRPALATLARVTGSTTTAFSGLDLALALSVATGRDLSLVTAALSRAYNGNLTSLKRLNLRLDENKVKNKDINGIINDLRKTYGAFAANELNTTANQINRIKVAAGEASEVIGVSLIQAISKLVGTQNGVNNLSKAFEDIAFYISDVVSGATELISIYNKLKSSINLAGTETAKQSKYNTSILGLVRLIGKQQRVNQTIQKSITNQTISARNAEMMALKAKKESVNSTVEGTKKTVDQLIAEEAARRAGFKLTEDIDSIQTVAAARRLEEARQYKMQVLDAAQAQYDAIKNNVTLLDAVWQSQLTAFDVFLTALKAKAAQTQLSIGFNAAGIPTSPISSFGPGSAIDTFATNGDYNYTEGMPRNYQPPSNGPTNVMNVTMNTFGTQDFLSAVQQAQQEFARNGWSNSYAGR